MGQTTHEKKPVSNFLSMQCVVFEQTFMKFTEIFVPQNNFFTGKKRSGNHLSGHQW